MVGQLVKLPVKQLRVFRKLKSGGVDKITGGDLGETNAWATGRINEGNSGYAHLEFAIPVASLTVTTLDSTAITPASLVGSVSFMSNTGTLMTMVVNNFIVESSAPNYYFYLDGWVAADDIQLSPL